MNPDYETITAAQFTEILDLSVEQFELWVLAGRPTLIGKPVICESLEHYQELFERMNTDSIVWHDYMKYVSTLSPEMQGIFKEAKRIMEEEEDTLSDDFQLAVDIWNAFLTRACR